MDARAADVVGRDGLLGHVLDDQVFDDKGIELELAEVGREQQYAVGRQQPARVADERDVVALQVQLGAHGLGVGEGRRVEEDQVVLHRAEVAGGRLAQPLDAVGPHEAVLRAHQAVQLEVAARPVEVGQRQVDGGGRGGASGGRVDRRRARVGEQIEKAAGLRQVADHAPGLPVIEEQPGVEVVGSG